MAERPAQSMKARDEIHSRARKYLKTISDVPMGRGALEYAPPLSTDEVLNVASEILQLSLTPDRDGRYYLPCPGKEMHSGGKSARRDCEFMPDGAPTLRCFHESCSSALDELNRVIRSACGKAKVKRFTDSTARATKAAEALLIGFDMSDAEVSKLLSEWARSCTPQISPADLSAALKSAKRSYARDPRAAGCLLRGKKMPASVASPRPPQGEKLSVVSCAASKSKPVVGQGVGVEEPIYIGALGELAREIRNQVEIFKEDYGYQPDRILIGTSYLGNLPSRLCGIPTERWNRSEHTVYGEE